MDGSLAASPWMFSPRASMFTCTLTYRPRTTTLPGRTGVSADTWAGSTQGPVVDCSCGRASSVGSAATTPAPTAAFKTKTAHVLRIAILPSVGAPSGRSTSPNTYSIAPARPLVQWNNADPNGLLPGNQYAKARERMLAGLGNVSGLAGRPALSSGIARPCTGPQRARRCTRPASR